MLKNWKRKLVMRFLPWFIGIIYSISPIDIIPDFTPLIGWLDDISVIAVMALWFFKMIKPSRKNIEDIPAGNDEDRKK